MRRVISHKQFSQLLGGSREVDTLREGEPSGYYVSRDPRVPLELGGSLEVTSRSHDEQAVKEHHDAIKDVSSKVVPTGYMSARSATPDERRNVFQGIWQNEDTGKQHLDVSDRIGKKSSETALLE